MALVFAACGEGNAARQLADAAVDSVPDSVLDATNFRDGGQGGPITGLKSRSRNPSCVPPVRAVSEGVDGLPANLLATGCFERSGGKLVPVAAAIPYAVNAPLWSDGASKDRWLVLPDEARIRVTADGDFELPPNSVLIKTFRFGERPIETRFFVRHPDGAWSGYTYAWNEAGTEAALLDEGSRRQAAGDREWHFPSRAECDSCHTEGAGRSLGLEVGQLDGELVYPGGVRANQLATLAAIGMFDNSFPGTDPTTWPATWVRVPAPDDASVGIEARARAYLHANCANCHRPGVGNSGTSDLRMGTALAATKTCDEPPLKGTLGHGSGVRLLAPGNPDASMLLLRMRALDSTRMPTVASLLVDDAGVNLVGAWIAALAACP
ncbi:MAG TPA: hypothetical protein VGF45_20980 [Polyangia bacterium]